MFYAWVWKVESVGKFLVYSWSPFIWGMKKYIFYFIISPLVSNHPKILEFVILLLICKCHILAA